jgi:LacI family transcriptional regulator
VGFIELHPVRERPEAEHLIDKGHRRIAGIGGREGVSSHEERLAGCRLAFEQRGLTLDKRYVALARFGAELAQRETVRLLREDERPTAIISLSIFMTLGVMRALSQQKLVCPRDVALVGIDDIDWVDLMNPRPTMISQPISEMTRTAISMLLEQIVSGSAPERRTRLFDPTLIVLDSSG